MLQSYTFRGLKFQCMNGTSPIEKWVPVNEEEAAALRQIPQRTRPNGSPVPNSPSAFDVLTKNEARELKRREHIAAVAKATGVTLDVEELEDMPPAAPPPSMAGRGEAVIAPAGRAGARLDEVAAPSRADALGRRKAPRAPRVRATSAGLE